MLLVYSLILGMLASIAHAAPSSRPHRRRQEPSATTSADNPVPTICGDIIDDVNQGYLVFYAEAAYSCLVSVPFNDAVALRFIEYYNTTMQFQSTLAYVKDPPEGYQQPAFDFFGGLEQLKQNVTSGVYKNQYAFEADMQQLVYRVHDTHVDLYAGILSAFSFASPYEILSVSSDGKEKPKVYLKGDILGRLQYGWDISPIETINGEDVIDFLTRFAALQSIGMVEPNGDWNQLMSGPAQDILGAVSVFSGGATFYPGDPSQGYWGDALNFTFANGSDPLETYWLAIYNNPDFTGPLTTGGDFYNYFVLGLLPDSYDEVELPEAFADASSIGNDAGNTTTGWSEVSEGAYPDNPNIIQDNLASDGGGFITGYFLDDVSTGVLSIPSFNEYSDSIGTFADAVAYFTGNATERGISKVVIDLQQNYGGTSMLAFTTFKRFFPNIDPFAGSRRRSHEMADILGTTKTNYWDSLRLDNDTEAEEKYEMEADEWVVTTRLNADTGDNFTSWVEYYGPREDNGDSFSLTERYDLANEYFDIAAFDGWVPTAYTPGNEPEWSAPWAPEDIVILTDGVCSSACALFVEMMTRQGGVKTIVVGGHPTPGPMQAASGSRGARLYSAYSIDDDIDDASSYNDTAANQLPQVRDSGMVVSFASFNLRDQIRDKETIPLQFKYLAADCRIWYTFDNVYNMTALWRDAARATWDDPSLCVDGSTGFAISGNKTAAANPPPKPTALTVSIPEVEYDQDLNLEEAGGLPDGHGPVGKPDKIKTCDPKKANTECSAKQACVSIPVTCSNKKSKSVYACVSRCQNRDNYCSSETEFCWAKSSSESVRGTSGVSSKNAKASFQAPLKSGYCVPHVGTSALGCPFT
ncbi:hypothetical protein F4809DRAFT_588177 [Biscogniauxia mediterranea]|nr:hypothetical protein F4809DRAFT_588177 [Biscogniauxia mediterranea]